MTTLTWVVIAIVIVVAIVLAILAFASRRGRLRPLPEGARARYAESWHAIEARFVDEPQQAVSEADNLVLTVYRERGGRDERLPGNVRQAREVTRSGDGESMTENLRRAMQHYRSALEDLIGADPRNAGAQREIAS
jgi:hypothetical protein